MIRERVRTTSNDATGSHSDTSFASHVMHVRVINYCELPRTAELFYRENFTHEHIRPIMITYGSSELTRLVHCMPYTLRTVLQDP